MSYITQMTAPSLHNLQLVFYVVRTVEGSIVSSVELPTANADLMQLLSPTVGPAQALLVSWIRGRALLSDVRFPLLGTMLVITHYHGKGLLEIAGQLRTESKTMELIGMATMLMVQAGSMLVGCGVLRSGSKDGYRPSSTKLLLNMRGRFQDMTTPVEAATYGTVNAGEQSQMLPRGFQHTSIGMATLQTGPTIGTEALASTASDMFAMCLMCSVGLWWAD